MGEYTTEFAARLGVRCTVLVGQLDHCTSFSVLFFFFYRLLGLLVTISPLGLQFFVYEYIFPPFCARLFFLSLPGSPWRQSRN